MRDELIAVAADRIAHVVSIDTVHPGDRREALARGRVLRHQDDRLLGTVLADETRRHADVNHPPLFDDRHAIAEAFGFLHEMRRQQHGLATIADAAHHLPDRATCLRVEARRQLVEQHDFGIVNQRQRDEQALLLSA